MPIEMLERPAVAPDVVAQATKIMQEHLDKEAKNRRQSNLAPRDLCPMQKADLCQELAALLH